MVVKTAGGIMENNELEELKQLINLWNANRYDMFEISAPDETGEFHGVMRFYFQEHGAKVATKCIRVGSTATTNDVIATLIEKFRPDMRMLDLPEYSLYEVHVNGEERKLGPLEQPLFVQLNWGVDDREGRFLLKTEGDVKIPAREQTDLNRKLSKRESKKKKKREKEAEKKNEKDDGHVAEKLYSELPETSFTRSISNPEAVMRRRRQQKLEKKLQEYRSQDGGPDTGGTLKIYGECLDPKVPYKTLLLSITDRAYGIVRQTLDKYGFEKEDADNYCLYEVHIPQDGEFHGTTSKEKVLDDDEAPLAILMHPSPTRDQIIFQIRKRPADHPPRRRRKQQKPTVHADATDSARLDSPQNPKNTLPFLLQLNPDGSDIVGSVPVRHKLYPNVTEVGSERPNTSEQCLQLFGPDIHPRHCLIACTGGIVTVTPSNPDAETWINNQRIQETTMLQDEMVVRFGRMHTFLFCDSSSREVSEDQGEAGNKTTSEQPNYETTFDVDGHIQTSVSSTQLNRMADMSDVMRNPSLRIEVLPATLEFRENAESQLLSHIIAHADVHQLQFKLAPTYTLYMAIRYRASRQYRPDASPMERAQRLTAFANRIANIIGETVQAVQNNGTALAFWMANASELLHFLKCDRDIGPYSVTCQDTLADVVHLSFKLLTYALQRELDGTLLTFLEDTDMDVDGSAINPVLSTLASAMALLRRCRVNAALTIQLFSQLFHYINMWLFNTVVNSGSIPSPKPQQLCTYVWGGRLKRRLHRVEVWAEKQGLELAADCHLCRVTQTAHLLQTSKHSVEDISNISSACFKLNSLQLRALLEQYQPESNEPPIPKELVKTVISVAENTADELIRSDGRQVLLEEEADLQLPFLLPEDGYSSEIIRGLPPGLDENIKSLMEQGVCRLTIQPMSSGMWTIYMGPFELVKSASDAGRPSSGRSGASDDLRISKGTGAPWEPEMMTVTFPKKGGGIGLSIVAAKGVGQEEQGIYVKKVVKDAAADDDGRLGAGDQLVSVNGNSLIGVSQERAAEIMASCGQLVTFQVVKQAAIYHGLATLLSQPSPELKRSSTSTLGDKGMPIKKEPLLLKHDQRRTAKQKPKIYSNGRLSESKSVPDLNTGDQRLKQERLKTQAPGSTGHLTPVDHYHDMHTSYPNEPSSLQYMPEKFKSTGQLPDEDDDDDGGFKDPNRSSSSSHITRKPQVNSLENYATKYSPQPQDYSAKHLPYHQDYVAKQLPQSHDYAIKHSLHPQDQTAKYAPYPQDYSTTKHSPYPSDHTTKHPPHPHGYPAKHSFNNMNNISDNINSSELMNSVDQPPESKYPPFESTASYTSDQGSQIQRQLEVKPNWLRSEHRSPDQWPEAPEQWSSNSHSDHRQMAHEPQELNMTDGPAEDEEWYPPEKPPRQSEYQKAREELMRKHNQINSDEADSYSIPRVVIDPLKFQPKFFSNTQPLPKDLVLDAFVDNRIPKDPPPVAPKPKLARPEKPLIDLPDIPKKQVRPTEAQAHFFNAHQHVEHIPQPHADTKTVFSKQYLLEKCRYDSPELPPPPLELIQPPLTSDTPPFDDLPPPPPQGMRPYVPSHFIPPSQSSNKENRYEEQPSSYGNERQLYYGNQQPHSVQRSNVAGSSSDYMHSGGYISQQKYNDRHGSELQPSSSQFVHRSYDASAVANSVVDSRQWAAVPLSYEQNMATNKSMPQFLDSETIVNLLQEIEELKSLPSRTTDEEARLRALKLEYEFQRRLLEIGNDDEDDNDEYDDVRWNEDINIPAEQAELIEKAEKKKMEKIHEVLPKSEESNKYPKFSKTEAKPDSEEKEKAEKMRLKKLEELRKIREAENEALRELQAARHAEEKAIEEARKEQEYLRKAEMQVMQRKEPQPDGNYIKPQDSMVKQQSDVDKAKMPKTQREVSFSHDSPNVNDSPWADMSYGYGQNLDRLGHGQLEKSAKQEVATPSRGVQDDNITNNNVKFVDWQTPPFDQQFPNLIATATPGVIGAQESYRDPRERRLLDMQLQADKSSHGEHLSFKDKMKLFASDLGETNTPPEKSKISRKQRDLEEYLQT